MKLNDTERVDFVHNDEDLHNQCRRERGLTVHGTPKRSWVRANRAEIDAHVARRMKPAAEPRPGNHRSPFGIGS